jgi:hypothetical protein
MLVDRYPPLDLFAFVPKLLEEFEPELRELADSCRMTSCSKM